MLGLWRRRRRTVLCALAAILVGGIFFARHLQGRVANYAVGERPDGLVDRLDQRADAGKPDVRFVDVAQEAGLTFRHFPATRSNRLPEDMGSGLALGDVNGDGWTDAFLANVAGSMDRESWDPEAGRSRLYLNRGAGRFEDVTATCGIDLFALANGAAFVDVDSDADLDLFVTTYGQCHLYLNDGAGHFSDASQAAGLLDYQGFWTGVAVADMNLDGAMDIYVTGYVQFDENAKRESSGASQYGLAIPALINPSTFEPERNLLLVGGGDGSFREMAEEAGVADQRGRGLGALFCDLNADGLPDLYVANDVSDNALFLNQGDGRFLDRTAQALVGDYRGAMGLAAADYDGDLDIDLFITHWVAQENALYAKVEGKVEDGIAVPLYFDEANRCGLGHKALEKVGWGTRFFDYDNDGLLDLFVVNGSTIPLADDPTRLAPMESQLFWRSPKKQHFFEVGTETGSPFSVPHVGRGGATCDYDLDGDEDLLISVHGGHALLLRNDGGNALPNLRLRLRQPEGNRFAIGARVLVTIGGEQYMDLVGSQGSYLSQHAVGEISFGMGSAALVDSIEVHWPDGEVERAGPFLAHSLVHWTRGEAPVQSTLPGRKALDLEGPTDIANRKRFFALRSEAVAARLAGNTDAAVANYGSALALWPSHGDCLYYLGNTWIALGSEQAALAAFQRLVHFEARSNQGWMQIGLMRLPGGDSSIDDLDAAQRAFLQCADINGEESRPVLQLGVVAMLQDRLIDAEQLFDSVTALNPKSVEAFWHGGRIAFLRGNRELALTKLSSAHGLIQQAGAGESVSNEGDTRSGQALTEEGGIALSPLLVRWRSLEERPLDIDQEYGPL